MNHGTDIENAIKNIWRTNVAHLQPNRKEQTSVKMLARISNWFEWKWPNEGDLAGYIQAHELPHIGKWKDIAPAKLDKLTNIPIEKPTPTNTSHTIPKTIWTMPLLKKTLNHGL